MELRVALGQIDVVAGRPDLNYAACLAALGRARDQGADLLVLPEMCIPGYFLGDSWEQPAFLRDCEEYGSRLVRSAVGLAICFGNVAVDWDKRGEDGRPRKYNACFVASEGRLLGGDTFPYPFRVKALHPNYREFDDTRHFFCLRKLADELHEAPETMLQPVALSLRGREVGLGCLLCEDGWADDYWLHPMGVLAARGDIDLFVNISASPFTLGKNGKRHRVFGRQVRELGIPLVYVNCVGIQNIGKTVYTFDGESTVYDRSGSAAYACGAYSDTVETFPVSLSRSDSAHPECPSPGAHGVEAPSSDTGIEALHRALSYGIGRFTEGIGMKRAVIGLSGGIDSAVAACLYCQVLGPRNVLVVNMPSRYNSDTTKGLAASLARNLGCLYTVVPIQEAVDLTVRQVSEAIVEDMADHTTRHLALTPFMVENVQARDRSSRVLAAIAAAFGCGFTCNGNKAEFTVGYATLYGDEAGFLAAMADLWKHQVYDLARYMNSHIYKREVLPQGSIDIVPSAELSAAQAVDEGKGDPIVYPYHDYLFRAFVERWNRATPEDVLSWWAAGTLEETIGCEQGLVARLFPGPSEFIADLERWWRQYAGIGVAKRIQAPPVLAVSRRAFGFDHREAQNTVYYTAAYEKLKADLLRRPALGGERAEG